VNRSASCRLLPIDFYLAEYVTCGFLLGSACPEMLPLIFTRNGYSRSSKYVFWPTLVDSYIEITFPCAISTFVKIKWKERKKEKKVTVLRDSTIVLPLPRRSVVTPYISRPQTPATLSIPFRFMSS